MKGSSFLVASLSILLCAVGAQPATVALKGHRAGPATIFTGCVVNKMAALTFDDGPNIYEAGISDVLTAHGVRGTFFVNGDLYNCIYDKQIVKNLRHSFLAGHQIGSHTWAHLDLTTLNETQIHSEMSRTELALQKILGVTPAFMRPPFGSYNDLVRNVSGTRGQSLVIWNVDTRDWAGLTVAESEAIYQTAIDAKQDTILPLMHETFNTTAFELLPWAIKALKAAGYRFGTVAECVGQRPYQAFNLPRIRDRTWTC
ncbi:hypothetical protein HGRIS_000020 [Hohenbuehelia grisea]|uniref:NodB homology domain-containing protein n=1 Tax=Hohenbuehelia grisea TaxID=104357 RepID=A0ABR3JRN3_9AGAR